MQVEKDIKTHSMHVPMKRGVADLSDAEEEMERPQKKTKMEEITFSRQIHREVSVSHMSMMTRLTESTLVRRAYEERQEADTPAGPPGMEDHFRAQPPEWLGAPHCDFRCMGGCWSYPSVAILHGYMGRQGFCCHAPHDTLFWQKSKDRRNRTRRRRKRRRRRRN